MRRERPAPAKPTAVPPQDNHARVEPDADETDLGNMHRRFTTTIAHLDMAAEAAVQGARDARFHWAEQQRSAQRGGWWRRVLAGLRRGR